MHTLSHSERLERLQEVRERILNCAYARVSSGGFANLTMQALADDVGIATGSLYRHFSSKGELAAELFSRASRIELDILAQTFRSQNSCAQRLAEGIQQFASRAWQSRSLAFALIAEPVDSEVDEQRLLFREGYAELFVELLMEGNRAGQWHVEHPKLVAACLVGAIAEALVGPLAPAAGCARQASRLEVGLEVVSRSLVNFCLRAVGALEP